MSTPSLRFVSLQRKLLGALALGLSIILLCALGGLGMAWLSLSGKVPPEVAQASSSEQISRDFRMQVQEWKNVLIRGRDPVLLDKHLSAFRDKGRQVQASTEALAKATQDPQARALSQQFAQAHLALQLSYEAALKQFAQAG